MNKRISKEALAIANKYIAAKTSREFDEVPAGCTPQQIVENVRAGAVYEELLKEIEFRCCSMTSMLYAGVGLGVTEAYKKAVRNAFKQILDK